MDTPTEPTTKTRMNLWDWTYNGKRFTPEMIGVNVGFIYLITCAENGKKYIGKKNFTESDTKWLWTKKGLAEMKAKGIKKTDLKTVDERRPYSRRKLGRASSNWVDYWGSATADGCALDKDIAEFGKEAFTREILELVRFNGELSYAEVRHIVLNDAVRRPDFYNNNVKINCRGVNTITSALTRSQLYTKCREENPDFARTHGPQAPHVDRDAEELETYSHQNMSKEEYTKWLMTS